MFEFIRPVDREQRLLDSIRLDAEGAPLAPDIDLNLARVALDAALQKQSDENASPGDIIEVLLPLSGTEQPPNAAELRADIAVLGEENPLLVGITTDDDGNLIAGFQVI